MAPNLAKLTGMVRLPKLFAPPADPAHLVVQHEGRVFKVALRRNAQARRLLLRVDTAGGQAILTLPRRTSITLARDFAARYAGWIAARLSAVAPAAPFRPGDVVPLRGVPHRIDHADAVRGVTRADIVAGESVIVVHGDGAHLARRVTDFLKAEARKDLTAAAARYGARLGVEVGRISIKDTRSRWGSCSAAGDLAFSWRLIMAPPHVLDYLAAHEVAHRLEMNHSPRYWRIVKDACQDTEAAEIWLKRHGPGLHRYGRA